MLRGRRLGGDRHQFGCRVVLAQPSGNGLAEYLAQGYADLVAGVGRPLPSILACSSAQSLGVIDYDCPFSRLRPIKLQERPLSYLTRPQIQELLAALDARATSPHPAIVARICLATGARWGEAQGLTPDRIHGNSLVFANTKSKRVRSVPVAPELVVLIRDHWKRHGPFSNCIGVFRLVLLTTSIRLPKGQASHVLRHTFASHFVQAGGSIVTLKEILGHASLSMTMRYAHLAKDHLEDAVRLGPLAGFDTFSTPAAEGNKKAKKKKGLDV